MNGRMWAGVGIVVLLAGGLIAALALGGGNGGAAAAPTTVTSTTEPGGDTSAPSSSSTTEVTPAPSTTSSTEAPPTTVPAATTTEPVDPNAPPDNSVDDPLQAVLAIREWFGWVSRNPSLESVDLYFSDRCDCYEILREQIAELVDNQWIYDDEGITVIAVMEQDSVSRKEEDRTFRIVDYQPHSRLVDSDGNVIREGEGWPVSVSKVRVVRDDDGRWRARTFEREEPIEEYRIRATTGELLSGWEAWDYVVENLLPEEYAYLEFEGTRP